MAQPHSYANTSSLIVLGFRSLPDLAANIMKSTKVQNPRHLEGVPRIHTLLI